MASASSGKGEIIDKISIISAICKASLFIVKLRQGSGKERQGKARMAKGERP